MQLEDIQTLKIIVVGETNVGKSSLIRKIITGKFDDKTVSLFENIEYRIFYIKQSQTIGCDNYHKIIERRHKRIRVQLWDTAGSEQFHSLSRMFIRKSMGCIIVSDMTEETSLLHSVNWKNLVQANSEHTDQLPIILVQNKRDLVDPKNYKRWQQPEYVSELAQLQGFAKWFQISTIQDNVEFLIDECIDEIMLRKIFSLNGSLQSTSFTLGNHFQTSSSILQKKETQENCCQNQ